MLDLVTTKSVKPLLIGIFQEPQRVPETERRLGTKLRFEVHPQRRRSNSTRGRSERGCANKGGE